MEMCRYIYLLLNQRKWWWTSKDERIKIKHMSVRHKRNALKMMERHASDLAEMYTFGEIEFGFPRGEAAQDDFDLFAVIGARSREAEPLAWLRGTPLVSRLAEDVRQAEQLTLRN